MCVDENLEDDWLEHLNALKAFDLISICEGHSNRQQVPARTSPHIRLRLKEIFLSSIARHWDEQKMVVVSKVNRLFETGDTSVSLDLRFKLRLATGRLNYREEMIVGVNRRRSRVSEEIDTNAHAWFQQNVDRIEELDTHIVSLWDETNLDSTGSVMPNG